MDYGGSWIQIPSRAQIFSTSQWVASAIHFIYIILTFAHLVVGWLHL